MMFTENPKYLFVTIVDPQRFLAMLKERKRTILATRRARRDGRGVLVFAHPNEWGNSAHRTFREDGFEISDGSIDPAFFTNRWPVMEAPRWIVELLSEEVTLGAEDTKRDAGLSFPRHVINGVAGDFANLYSGYLEPPLEFFYMAYLTCLGSLFAKSLTLRSEVAPQPRLFVLLLGQSADDRKSTALAKTVEHFKEAIPEGFNFCFGVNSAEGLQKIMIKKSCLLLCFDEFKSFLNKCRIESSVLLPCVNSLFELNRYETHTKKSDVLLEDAHLSLLAASTVQTSELLT